LGDRGQTRLAWKTPVGRLRPVLSHCHGPTQAGVDPWSHYCWLNLHNLLEPRGADATLTSFLEPTEDDPEEGFDESMGAPVQYTLMGEGPTMSFGNHSRPQTRILNFPKDPKATALLQPIPRMGDNASRPSVPVADAPSTAWVKGTALLQVGCVYDPSRRFPSSRNESEKNATRGFSARVIEEVREAFAVSLLKERPDRTNFASSGPEPTHLPSNWDLWPEDQSEAGSSVNQERIFSFSAAVPIFHPPCQNLLGPKTVSQSGPPTIGAAVVDFQKLGRQGTVLGQGDIRRRIFITHMQRAPHHVHVVTP